MSDTNIVSRASSGHSPGPWRPDEKSGTVYDTDGVEIAYAWRIGSVLGGPVGAANTRLIAAAPDLLALCQRAEALLNDLLAAESPELTESCGAEASVLWLNIRAAIAAATGEVTP